VEKVTDISQGSVATF